MPIFVFLVAMMGDFGFVLGRMATVFFAIRLGADTSFVLLMGAAEGLTYTVITSRFAGPLIQRFGAPPLVKLAGAGLAVNFLFVPLVPRLWWLWFCTAWGGIPLALFWPSLQARLVERVAPASVPRVQGAFNLAWAAAILCSLATSGWLFELGWDLGWGPWLALGVASLVSAAIALTPLPAGRLPGLAGEPAHERAVTAPAPALSPHALRLFGIAGWVGNFTSYLVFDTCRLVFPSLGQELGFSERLIGLVMGIALCSQVGVFLLAILWRGWLYKRRWLYGAIGLHLGALGLLAVGRQPVMFGIGFAMVGAALALTYTASLYYSLGATESAGHAGGRHEAMIGASRIIGPVLGAVAASVTASSRAPFLVYACVVALILGILLALFARMSRADRTAILAAQGPAIDSLR